LAGFFNGLLGRDRKIYSNSDEDDGERIKGEHVLLLWDAGFVRGIDASNLSGRAVLSPDLT
jgi:hypothetical protein